MDTFKNNGLDSELEPQPPNENVLENMETINDLPVEMLEKVFGYLTHTQKLISRLVCTQWNHQISSILSNNSYFKLKSKKSHQLFLDSDVEWTKIELLNLGFQIPEKKRNVIKTFQTDISMLEELGLVLIQFPNVISLELNIIENKNLVHSTLKNGKCGDQFRRILTKLKILSIKSTMPNYKNFYGIIKDIAGAAEMLVLNELKLQINEVDGVDEVIENEPGLFSEIYTIILKSSRTLHSLTLDFECVSLFPELISKLCDLDELKLKSAWINIQWEWMDEEKTTEEAELELLIYKKFFNKYKSAVRSIHLLCSLDEPVCQELIHSVSKSIEVVKDVDNARGVSDLLSTFTKLRTIEIDSDDFPLFSHECPGVRECHITSLADMQDVRNGTVEIADFNDKAFGFYKSLHALFINLVELHIGDIIGVNCDGFYDFNLQLIIYNMCKLKILHLERGFRISDYGVTGIELKYSEDLLETNKLHLHQCIPEEKMYGRPLSSLAMLEKLVIHEESMSRITDFGIFYGLQFGPTMKHLSIGSNYGNISDWGLYWLGAGNPCLESFSGTFKSNKIVDGAELMMEQLELIKFTKKFKVVNVTTITSFREY